MLDYNSDNRTTFQALSLPTNAINKLALSPDEVAEKLQVDVSDVDRLIENGELIEKKIGDKRRITTNSLLHYLNGESCDVQQPSPGGKHLVTDILDIVLERKKASCRKLSSYKWYCDIAKHIRIGFYGKFVEDLTQNDILNFMTNVSKNKDGKLMSHHLLSVLEQLLKILIKYSLIKGYITINPFDFIATIPCGKKSSPKDRVLSRKTIVKLINALDHSPTFKPMVILLLHTGMRIGEALALNWSDIDEDNQIIHIHHGLTLVFDEDENGKLINKRYEIGDTKTVCSTRDITIDKETLDALREWKDSVENNRVLTAYVTKKGNKNLVFVNKYGELRSYQSLQKSFLRFLKTNGLENEHITFHMLRHTYATILQEAGVDIVVISELLGHADIQTTANIYVTVNIGPKRNAMLLFEKEFNRLYRG